MQNLIIKPKIVETHDQVGALQLSDQFVHLFFAVDFIAASRCAVSHPHAQAHLRNIAPTTDFIRRFLRFQIKIDNVFCHGRKFYNWRIAVYELFQLPMRLMLPRRKSCLIWIGTMMAGKLPHKITSLAFASRKFFACPLSIFLTTTC